MKLRKEVKVGIFALLTLLALYWGVNFLRGQDLFNRYKTYYATYDQANGIQKSSVVKIKGYKVGVVSDVSYNPKQSDKIIFELSIKSKYGIPDNSKARVISDGLMGGKVVEIEMGASGRNIQSGDTLYSVVDADFFEMAGYELEFFKERIYKLGNDISTTLSSINTLIAQNTKAITATMNNLEGITSSLNNVASSQEQNMKSLIANINSFSETLKNNSGDIDRIVDNVKTVTDSLSSAPIGQMMRELENSTRELNSILAGVGRGEGTMGKLINDEQLYKELTEASATLKALLEDLKANPGRYVTISVFGRKK